MSHMNRGTPSRSNVGKKCEVCVEATSIYKCPNCEIRYCSVVCFKKHKELPCSSYKQPEPTAVPKRKNIFDSSEGPSKSKLSEDTLHKVRFGIDEEDKLSEEDLVSLISNPKILSHLRDPSVRSVIVELLADSKTKDQLANVTELQENLAALPSLGKKAPNHPLFNLVPEIFEHLGR